MNRQMDNWNQWMIYVDGYRDRWMDRLMDEWIDRWMDKQTNDRSLSVSNGPDL